MRVRAMDSSGDFIVGRGSAEFLVNNSACVAQLVLTALKLHQGEFFLDVTAGVPWETQVLGYGTASLYDATIKNAILGVQGVSGIVSYSSSLNRSTRALTVTATITTIFSGSTPVTFNVQIPMVPPPSGWGYSPYGSFPWGSS
jgi:hypothetical protein